MRFDGPAAVPSAAADGEGAITVLRVDDDDSDLVDLAATFLEGENDSRAVLTATDAEEVLDCLDAAGYSTSDDGTGMGLRIVEGHGWQLACVERESGGARFEITGIDTQQSRPSGATGSRRDAVDPGGVPGWCRHRPHRGVAGAPCGRR